jgi:hypothetical protein
MLDLTAFESPKFVFKFRDGERVVEQAIDVSRIMEDLRHNVPELFKESGEFWTEEDAKAHPESGIVAGAPISNLSNWLRKWHAGDPLPDGMPNADALEAAIKASFRLPSAWTPGYGWDVCWALINGFYTELARLEALKKSTAGSPESSAPTPASADSKT